VIYLLTAFIFSIAKAPEIWWAGYICTLIIDVVINLMEYDK